MMRQFLGHGHNHYFDSIMKVSLKLPKTQHLLLLICSFMLSRSVEQSRKGIAALGRNGCTDDISKTGCANNERNGEFSGNNC